MPGTERLQGAFWSPDSTSVGFFVERKLKRVDVAGGTPVTVCDLPDVARGGTWNEAGIILFGAQNTEGVYQVPASGGTPTLVTHMNKANGDNQHYFPQFLPNGREFFYRAGNNDPAKMGIAFGALGQPPTATSPVVLVTGNDARYDASSGQLLYIDGADVLKAQRLELNPPRLVGNPVVVAEGVQAFITTHRHADFSVSREGTLAYVRKAEIPKSRFAWRDRSGKPLGAVGKPVEAGRSFSVSPDGTRVAYFAGPNEPESDVWVMDLVSGLQTRLSFNKGMWPRWSPDGKSVYYSNPTGFVRRPADGSGDETLLAKALPTSHVWSVSPDGKTLLVGNAQIQSLDASGQMTPFLPRGSSGAKTYAAFSPDGRWVAYTSYEAGRNIYIQDYPEKRGKWLISASEGDVAVWRADGRELFWSGLDGKLMSATIAPLGDRLEHGPPRALFDLPPSVGEPKFGVSRDGQKFLVLEPEAAIGSSSAVVVVNWTATLNK